MCSSDCSCCSASALPPHSHVRSTQMWICHLPAGVRCRSLRCSPFSSVQYTDLRHWMHGIGPRITRIASSCLDWSVQSILGKPRDLARLECSGSRRPRSGLRHLSSYPGVRDGCAGASPDCSVPDSRGGVHTHCGLSHPITLATSANDVTSPLPRRLASSARCSCSASASRARWARFRSRPVGSVLRPFGR